MRVEGHGVALAVTISVSFILGLSSHAAAEPGEPTRVRVALMELEGTGSEQSQAALMDLLGGAVEFVPPGAGRVQVIVTGGLRRAPRGHWLELTLYAGSNAKVAESFRVRVRSDGRFDPPGEERVKEVLLPAIQEVALQWPVRVEDADLGDAEVAQSEQEGPPPPQDAPAEDAADVATEAAEETPPVVPRERPMWSQSKFIFMTLEDYGQAPSFEGTYTIGVYLQRFNLERKLADRLSLDSALVFEAATWNLDNPLFAVLGMDTVIDTVPQGLPLQWSILTTAGEAPTGERLEARVRFDRISLQSQFDWGSISVGRQNYDVSTGLLFPVLDVLTPLPVATADGEFRPGIDSLRADLDVTDDLSLTLAYALGADWDGLDRRSEAFAFENARAVAMAELALDGGRAFTMAGVLRQMPLFGGGAAKQLGQVLVKGEAALALEDNALGTRPWFAMVQAGAHYVAPKGWIAGAEAIYSGFGATNTEDYPAVISHDRIQNQDVPFQLGQIMTGAYAVVPLHERVDMAAVAFLSPLDGSGRIRPQVTLSDGSGARASLALSLPWGERPDDPLVPVSETSILPVALVLNAAYTY